ncbi:hypothetical protein TNCV_3469531 [Trichonephila clavipes]|nr:hypothetical protein TNCV_3469531 [Trichonephila clavipes]
MVTLIFYRVVMWWSWRLRRGRQPKALEPHAALWMGRCGSLVPYENIRIEKIQSGLDGVVCLHVQLSLPSNLSHLPRKTLTQ